MPTYNVYIPTRHHILNKPDITEGEYDDLGYKFNLNRVSPAGYLNTLKGYHVHPSTNPRPVVDMSKQKHHKKWRRLS